MAPAREKSPGRPAGAKAGRHEGSLAEGLGESQAYMGRPEEKPPRTEEPEDRGGAQESHGELNSCLRAGQDPRGHRALAVWLQKMF